LHRVAIWQPSISPVRIVFTIASSFGTGSTPGIPRHTGQTWELLGPPNSFLHEQNIFVFVLSWQWTSSPITTS